jgi:nitrite reductase/ring-hydroxylating ferredoxin subunit
MPRRDFLGKSAQWSAGAALVFAAVGMARLPRAAVVSSPSRKFRVRLPESLPAGEPFLPPGRSVALFRDAQGVWAVSTVCTHLGCIVKTHAAGFECPCHGSRFTADGVVEKGPAPKALAWHKVVLEGDDCIVDEDSVVPAGTKVSA